MVAANFKAQNSLVLLPEIVRDGREMVAQTGFAASREQHFSAHRQLKHAPQPDAIAARAAVQFVKTQFVIGAKGPPRLEKRRLGERNIAETARHLEVRRAAALVMLQTHTLRGAAKARLVLFHFPGARIERG